jgi:hypothetical protein
MRGPEVHLLVERILTWICLMAGVHSVKRNVISRTVYSLRDVTSRPMFATDTCMMYYVARIDYLKSKTMQNTQNNTD